MIRRGIRGEIDGRKAEVRRRGGRLELVIEDRAWAFDDVVVDHRDEDARITFRVLVGAVEAYRAEYDRPGESKSEQFWDMLDFTADEPWSWEDGDFGLLVFHVATGTGPMKFRHRIEAPGPYPDPNRHVHIEVLPGGVRHALLGERPGHVEEVSWDALEEVAAKFEVAGIWAERTILVLREARRLCVVPVSAATEAAMDPLRSALASLPGFGEEQLAQLDEAVAYGRADWWPKLRERDRWAEWSIWTRG